MSKRPARASNVARLPRAKVAFATISLDDNEVFTESSRETISQALSRSLVVGEPVTRYNKEWRLERWTVRNGYISGRLGFQRVLGTTEVWNNRTQHFELTAVEGGQTSPFVLHLASGRVVFQLRTKDIYRGSFRGALKAILNRSSDVYRWDVELDMAEVTFDDWLGTVDRVTKIAFNLKPPNPNYQGRPLIEDAIEKTGAASTQIIINAPKGSGAVDITSSQIVRQALLHVQRTNSSLKADGVRARGSGRARRLFRAKFDSDKVLPIREVTAQADKEVSHEVLRRELDRGTPELEE